jgi:hypothetical protein
MSKIDDEVPKAVPKPGRKRIAPLRVAFSLSGQALAAPRVLAGDDNILHTAGPTAAVMIQALSC